MAPRAAARLETLGFGQVHEYRGGKLDWMAAGLPTEGENSLHPRAGDAARKDVPICSLTDRLGDVRDRVKAAGWDAALAVDGEGVVLGLLRSKELAKDPDLRIEQAMRPGPGTCRPKSWRPGRPTFMKRNNGRSCPGTSSDGTPAGWLTGSDPVRLGS